MIDIQKIRENKAAIKENLQKRAFDTTVIDSIYEEDIMYRKYVQQVEELKQQRNMVSREVGERKRAKEDASDLLAEAGQLAEKIEGLDGVVRQLKEDIERKLNEVPNLLADDVPVGNDETDNVEIYRVGTPRTFDFEHLAHWDIAENLNIIDFERAAKVSGSRFSIYKGEGAKLFRSLIQFMLDVHVQDGYEEVFAPVVVRGDSLYATGQLPKFAEDVFQLAGENSKYLSPTAEVTLTNMHRNEILQEEQLPIKYCCYSSCFRSEVGSAGKDTRGIIRQRQFNKVELVNFIKAEEAPERLEALRKQAEKILDLLELPYRTILLCSGDTGFSNAKTYDIEVWLPSYGAYKEISSCSTYTDFQARRGMIRYRNAEGKNKFVTTLNGSALAIERTFAAILENYQQADGSVVIPKALLPYMSGIEILKK